MRGHRAYLEPNMRLVTHAARHGANVRHRSHRAFSNPIPKRPTLRVVTDTRAATPSRQHKYVCAECGSSWISCDATVSWNTTTQNWEIDDVGDNDYCSSCSQERRLSYVLDTPDPETYLEAKDWTPGLVYKCGQDGEIRIVLAVDEYELTALARDEGGNVEEVTFSKQYRQLDDWLCRQPTDEEKLLIVQHKLQQATQ